MRQDSITAHVVRPCCSTAGECRISQLSSDMAQWRRHRTPYQKEVLFYGTCPGGSVHVCLGPLGFADSTSRLFGEEVDRRATPTRMVLLGAVLETVYERPCRDSPTDSFTMCFPMDPPTSIFPRSTVSTTQMEVLPSKGGKHPFPRNLLMYSSITVPLSAHQWGKTWRCCPFLRAK